MGRKLRGPPPGDVRKYVPEAYGNRDDADPVVLWIKAPTELEKRRITAGPEPVDIARDESGKPRNDAHGNIVLALDLGQLIERQVDAVSKFVTRVDNYEFSDGKPISNGAELAEFGEADFVAEVYLEITKSMRLTDDDDTGEKKHLNEPSISTHPATSPGTTVMSASKMDNPDTATATIRKEIPNTSPSHQAD